MLVVQLLTAASGAGKTTILDALNKKPSTSSITCLHFDTIGVLTEQEMIAV
jgi:predicted ATPase